MEASMGIKTSACRKDEKDHNKGYYSRLFRRFVLLTLTCSVIPLLLVGWAINIHYTRFSKDRMKNSFQSQVENHRKIISLFLKQRRSELQLIAHTHSKDYLQKISNLTQIFETMNRDHRSYVDLGVIDKHGQHLAYIGPYNLLDKNYSKTFWFGQVMDRGLYISDMFMGFRKVPHFIIAVTRFEKGEKWILRATIDTESFRSLVENVRIGYTGEVYLLNQEGVFQTSPRFGGKIMEKAPFVIEPFHKGIRTYILKADAKQTNQRFPRQLISQTWLREPLWLLVVKQDYSEAFNEVNRSNYAILIFLHLSALTILTVSVLTARHMINVIKKRDVEAEQLNIQLVQTGKLAAVGELSAGVAHEINNPLAIVLTERQILLDLMKQTPNLDPDFKKQLSNSLLQVDVQVQRCKHITHNLLRFSRRTRSAIETVDINAFIREVVDLMEREAGTSGIKILTDLEKDLPPVLSDPSQLQQVFLNMITNAIDAHNGIPYGTIRIHTKIDAKRGGLWVEFADTGEGILPENLEKIFYPFFTTKEVGKGTGLGLSICYSIMQRLGGEINARSELGKGTKFRIFIPYEPPLELINAMADEYNL